MGRKITKLLDKISLFENQIEKIANSINFYYNNYTLTLYTDILESEDSLIIKIDIPGINNNCINIYNENDSLIIEGVKDRDDIYEKGKYLLAERSFGKFRNNIQISDKFDLKSIDHYIKNGVLHITIKKHS